MTPEAQQIAIAEACGFTEIRYSLRWEVSDPPDNPVQLCGLHPRTVGGKHWREVIPDYPNDLNAMNQAENVLSYEQEPIFLLDLKRTIIRIAPSQSADEFSVCHATAAQRAEAFLRTIGRWDDAK